MDDDYRAKVVACEKIHEKAIFLRGRFINTVAVIERDLALLLTDYFCTSDESKRELFYTKIVNSPHFH